MQQLGTWIFILGFTLAILLVFGVVIYSWRYMNQLNQQRRQLQQDLGFTVPAQASQAFESRIRALYGGVIRPRLKLAHVARRRTPDGDQFIFSLEETSGENNTQLADLDIAIVSPRLSLPRFSLYPRPEIDNPLEGLVQRLVTWAASQDRQAVDFSHHPTFAQRYLVTAAKGSAAAVQAFLDPARLDQLLCLETIAIEAGGDTFTVTHTPLDPGSTDLPGINELRRRLALADDLYRLFSAPARQAASSPLPTLQCTQCGARLPAPAPGASIVRCEYCGQEVMLWSDQPSAPAPVPPRHAFDVASPALTIGMRNLNAGANLFGRLLFSIFMTLFAGFIVVFTVTGYWKDSTRYDLLTRQGQHTTGVITRLQMETDSDGDDRYYVRFRFNAQVNGKTQPVESLQRISRQEHDQLKEGQKVAIVYAPSDPSTCDFASNLAPPVLTPYIVVGVIAGLFTLLGIFLFTYTAYRLITAAKTWLSPQPAPRS